MSKTIKQTKDEIMNIWLTDIDSLLSLYDGDGGCETVKRKLYIKFISDLDKETISIIDKEMEVQYDIPFKKIQELIDAARANKN